MAEIINIPINHLVPHPNNPRKDLGDLTELTESIKEKGVLQNLTVVSSPNLNEGYYWILIGHRRHAAAILAGLKELPCSIADMSIKDQIATMLIENMQRSDLTVYEQAQGFQMMIDLGSTVEEIAEKSGFSTTTVRRRVKMMELDQDKLKEVSCRQLSLSDFDRLAQIEDLSARNECLDKIGTNDFNFAVQKVIRAQRIEENMPDVKAWLKSVKAKSIQESDTWKAEYRKICSTIYIDKWKEDGNEPPQDAESKPLFYFMGNKDRYSYGQLDLFHKTERAAPVKRPPEEIARDKAINEAWSKLEEAAALAFDLRKKFVDSIGVTKKNVNDVLLGAVYAGGYNAFSYNDADRISLNEIFGFENTAYIPDREEKFFEVVDRIFADKYQIVKMIYALFGDVDSLMCSNGYRKEFPRYKRNVKLELIYKWLQMLGYEMSTDETHLLNGEHAAYHSYESFKEES